MCRTNKDSSYRKMFSALEKTEDFFEVDVLTRIRDEHKQYHENNL